MNDNGKNEFETSQTLINLYYDFLEKFNLDADLYKPDIIIIRDISKRYWRDVTRLHIFHDMQLIDCHKISGYLTYWICKLRPIHVSKMDVYKVNSETPIFINELFALYVGMGRINYHLCCNKNSKKILLTKKFIETFIYNLKYRTTSGDNLSIMYFLLENHNEVEYKGV